MNDSSTDVGDAEPERGSPYLLWWFFLVGCCLAALAPALIPVVSPRDPRLFLYPYAGSIRMMAAVFCLSLAWNSPRRVRLQWLLFTVQFVALSLSLWAPTLHLTLGWPSERVTAWLISGFATTSFLFSLLSLSAFAVKARSAPRLLDTAMTLILCGLNFLAASSTGPSGFSRYHVQVFFGTVVFVLIAAEATRRTAITAAERQFTTIVTIYLAVRVVSLFLLNIVGNMWVQPPRELPFDLVFALPELCFCVFALRRLLAGPGVRPALPPTALWASLLPSLVLFASVLLALHVNVDHPFIASLAIALAVVCFILRTHLIYQGMLRERQELVARTGHLEALASHDVLTGIGNRRWLEDTAFKLLQTGPEKRAALLLIDADRFKWINDTFGHGAGDGLLARIGRALQQEMAAFEGACCARIGGDEFAVLLPHFEADAALAAAELLRRRVEQLPSGDGVGHASISVGVAVTSGRVPLSSLLELADEALYQAKRSGRNLVELADEDAVHFPQRARHSEDRLFRSQPHA